MPRDPDKYDFFVSYARVDNRDGWISSFVEELLAEHRRFTGGRELVPFFDTQQIRSLDDWQQRLYHGLAGSRLFVAFISPNYFASEWCRREWRTWIDVEIAKHILSAGAAPLYIVEVPGLLGELDEQEVARRVAELCQLPPPRELFFESAAPLVHQLRRRQMGAIQPFYNAGLGALRQDDLRRVLENLARDLDERATYVKQAAQSETDLPPYNEQFTGRTDELLDLRQRLNDNRAGVISSIHGLGGVGKTELALTYAHAFAGAYPGGRFLLRCEGTSSLREAALVLGDLFHDQIPEEDRMTPDRHFAAIVRCLRARLDEKGHILLVLDNVTDTALLGPQQTDQLTCLGGMLHLLATTRLPAGAARHIKWTTLGELPEADALALLEKYRGFDSDAQRRAARQIVERLAGFALAVELVGAWMKAHPSATYAGLADGLGLDDLDLFAEDHDVELRRHNHQRRLQAVLGPPLETLTDAQRLALEYAACLAPDQVPLPWLRELVVPQFPELAEPGRLGDPWEELIQPLLRLALLNPAAGQGHRPRVVRFHRLVGDLLRRELTEDDLSARQKEVEKLVRRRDAALEQTTRWQEARWEIEPLDALARHWDENGHPDAAWLLNQVGVRWYDLAEWTRAEPLYRRAMAINEASFGPHHPKVGASLNNLAALLYATNRLAEAEPLYRRAMAINEASFGPHHPKVGASLNNLAALLYATNRLAEAEPLYRRALTIDEASYGPDHPKVAIRLNNLAGLLEDTNRLSEAEPLYRRALAIDEASYGPDHPEVATDLNNLAGLLRATNRLSEAEPLYRRALAIDEASYGPDHPEVATALNNLAGLLRATNRLAEAEPLYRRALAIGEASYGPDHPKVAIRLNNLAGLLEDTNRLSEAEPLYRHVVDILLKFTQATGHRHPHLEAAVGNYAGLLEAMGRSEVEVRQELNDLLNQYGLSLG